MGHVPERIPERACVAGHLEDHIESFDHPELSLRILEAAFARVDDERRTHRHREIAPDLVRFADDDEPRARVPRDAGRHQADRAGTDDQHVLAEDGELKGCVDRVPERVEDRGDLLGDPRPVVPHVGDGQDDLLGEGAIALDTETDGVRAEMPAARPTVTAAAAHDVPLAAYDIARREIPDVTADLEHFPDELVPDDQWRMDRLLGPRVPVGDVKVGAADARLVHADADVVDRHLWFRDITKIEAGAGRRFHERLHRPSVQPWSGTGRSGPR